MEQQQSPPQGWGQPQRQPPRRGGGHRLLKFAGIVVVALVGLAVLSPSGDDDEASFERTPKPTLAPETEPAEPAEEEPEPVNATMSEPAPAEPAEAPSAAPAAETPGTEPAPALPEGLRVAAEDRTGYDRDAFGDYDRDALLAGSLAAHPACDAYYSAADDQCHTEAGDVDVDHIVALAEAWDSGASGWDAGRLDGFAGDVTNLWLMTDSLNASKGDGDPAEWTPPHAPAVCGYLEAYVEVKLVYDLAVDQAELDALTGSGCELGLP